MFTSSGFELWEKGEMFTGMQSPAYAKAYQVPHLFLDSMDGLPSEIYPES
jgi:hypothetical protein